MKAKPNLLENWYLWRGSRVLWWDKHTGTIMRPTSSKSQGSKSVIEESKIAWQQNGTANTVHLPFIFWLSEILNSRIPIFQLQLNPTIPIYNLTKTIVSWAFPLLSLGLLASHWSIFLPYPSWTPDSATFEPLSPISSISMHLHPTAATVHQNPKPVPRLYSLPCLLLYPGPK